jgi:hypothetical protein
MALGLFGYYLATATFGRAMVKNNYGVGLNVFHLASAKELF